jgi:electron transfer flavoprotein beta subunit
MLTMKIVVCVKVVIDPEAPVSLFQIDTEAKKVIPPKGTPPVINPFDENALEAALKIKDCHGSSITVISMGKNIPRAIIRKTLAAGADKLILVEDNFLDDLDSYSTACILAETIKKLGDYDLIICGRQASDTDAGIVGSGIAEILGIPGITVARKVEINHGKLRVERSVSDGYVIIDSPLPALITASNEIGELRSAPLPAIIAAQKKEITVWNTNDIGIELSQLKRSNLLKLFQPIRKGKCEIIEGKTPEEAGANLAVKLREAKII